MEDPKTPVPETDPTPNATPTEPALEAAVPAETPTAPQTPAAKRPRGFAAMDRALVSEIARKGGKAAHAAGTAHEFSTDEARIAGRKGGHTTHARRRAKGNS